MYSFDIDIIFDATLSFEKRKKAVLDFQLDHNEFYNNFYQKLSYQAKTIPLIPIQLFRDRSVYSGEETPDLYFESSGTSGMQRSRHWIDDPLIYQRSLIEGFQKHYGNDFVIWAYTPGYNDNPHSSLVWMLNELIQREESGNSRFLPLDLALPEFNESNKRLMLFGAAFGLLDLAEHHPVKLPKGTIIMETGGMKTHRREMSRNEMHIRLR